MRPRNGRHRSRILHSLKSPPGHPEKDETHHKREDHSSSSGRASTNGATGSSDDQMNFCPVRSSNPNPPTNQELPLASRRTVPVGMSESSQLSQTRRRSKSYFDIRPPRRTTIRRSLRGLKPSTTPISSVHTSCT